jgi:hypothetical protein
MRTLPVERRIAVWNPRAVIKLPVWLKVPVTGSKISALASAPPEP